MTEEFTVHIAGPVLDGRFQACSRCGLGLIDYRACIPMLMESDPPRFWAEGARISKCGPEAVLIPERELEVDEVECR